MGNNNAADLALLLQYAVDASYVKSPLGPKWLDEAQAALFSYKTKKQENSDTDKLRARVAELEAENKKLVGVLNELRRRRGKSRIGELLKDA